MTDNAAVATRLFTSESVTEGHPDKICDAISDAILDALLEKDPASRVAVETLVTTGQVHVVGEVRTDAYVEIPALVRDTLKSIGFTSSEVGFDGNTCGVNIAIGEQSQEIGAGVDNSTEARAHDEDYDAENDTAGAGDQGLMFGYASNETAEFMPLPIALAHRLSRRLTQVRKEGIVDHLRPDGKTQVTFAYTDDNEPSHLDTVVISTQHDAAVDSAWLEGPLRSEVLEWVIKDAGLDKFYTEDTTLLVNPPAPLSLAGRWAMLALLAERSSSTPTVAWLATAAVLSPARIRARWTALLPMPCAGWLRILSLLVWQIVPKSRLPMQLAALSRWACTWRPSVLPRKALAMRISRLR